MTAMETLKTLLGPSGWSTDADELAPLLKDQRGRYMGATPLLVKPKSTEEVSGVLEICNRARIAVVPQGGNTGLCGGAVPHEGGGQVLMSLSRMSHIGEPDPYDYTMSVEAGAILKNIQDKAAAADLLFPLSLAAEGSCQIGGNLATNAGGLNVIRYGNARDLVLGLEVVLADGRIWNGLSRLRKNNSGYDLRHLMIGSEGTLGVITKAVLKLFPRPRSVETALIAVPDPSAALSLLATARRQTGDGVVAFELMSRFAFGLAATRLGDPMPHRHPWYVLLELNGAGNDTALRETLEAFLADGLEHGRVIDAVLAQSDTQRAHLWSLREDIPHAQKTAGASIKHDVSVPVSLVPELLDRATNAVVAAVPGVRPCPFGHVGDGNVHFNFSRPETMDDAAFTVLTDDIRRIVHDITAELGGSFSAEHGVGRLKVEELANRSSHVKLDMLRAIKDALDPNGILNPGKILAHAPSLD